MSEFMISLENHSAGRSSARARINSRYSSLEAGRFAVRFPDGEYPVQCAEMNRHEREFAARYLRDIDLLVSGDPERWSGWREMLADESCPVIEFDPEWFSFLLPPKSLTRMELFAWYWLWIEPRRELAVSRYAYCELKSAFEVAGRPARLWKDLANAVLKANAALLSGDEASLAAVLDYDRGEDPRDRIDGSLIWFPRLIVDHEPMVPNGPVLTGEPEIRVWGYLTSGEGGFDQVTGQIQARRVDGKWILNPRAVRTYRSAELSGHDEVLSAFSE